MNYIYRLAPDEELGAELEVTAGLFPLVDVRPLPGVMARRKSKFKVKQLIKITGTAKTIAI